MSTVRHQYHIHGDNIVECERTLRLIELAYPGHGRATQTPSGSPTNPSFDLVTPGGKEVLMFVFFPGFGRWDQDIRQLIRHSGGLIREAPDVIVSEVRAEREVPVIAFEYSGALAAGNQAWQRSGRAYSLGLARIPFLYIAELGGHELDAERVTRATRLPNPAVPFSYLSFTSSITTPVLPVFVPNPGIDQEVRTYFQSVIGEEQLTEFIRIAVLGNDPATVVQALERKTLTFVQLLASHSHRGRTLTPNQWSKAYQAVKGGGGRALVSYLLTEAPLPWMKTAYIEALTTSAKELMRIAAQLSIGLTSSQLPMCLVPPSNRPALAEQVRNLYRSIDDDFLQWLRQEEPLAICWVMGFKPRGDDARPDRGLPPLTRMLIGSDVDMMTVVYGPAPRNHWSTLVANPSQLSRQNGLWEAIMVASNAILADSATDDVTSHGFLRTHWASAVSADQPSSLLVAPVPKHIGENDVDTVIHTLFARLGAAHTFEGFCNPPGGDWSGISLLTPDKNRELRWLSLRRVSGADSKRPDHVLQIFNIQHIPIVFAIESKETPGSAEQGIGVRLTTYMRDLLSSPASIERDNSEGAPWQHSSYSVDPDDFTYASGVAFLVDDARDLTATSSRLNADLQIGLQFSIDGATCRLYLLPATDQGRSIAEFIGGLPLTTVGLCVHGHQ